MARRRPSACLPLLAAGLMAALPAAPTAATAAPTAPAAPATPQPASRPVSPGLLRSLGSFEKDLLELDGALNGGAEAAPPFNPADPALQAPPADQAPASAAAAQQSQQPR